MMMKLKMGRKFASGLIATLMIAFCLVCFTPTPVVHANGNQKTTDEDEPTEAPAGSSSNDLNDVTVSLGSDGRLTVDGLAEGNASNTWNTIFNKAKIFIVGFGGIGMLVFVALFIKNFMALGAASNNPTARSQALTGCLWTGIAAGACGSVTLITGLFWNAFKD